MYIQTKTQINASTVNDNVIAGNQFEFFPTRALAMIGLDSDAAGLEIDVLVGQRSYVTRFIPPTDNRFAKMPDEFTLKVPGLQGERLIIRARETSAANRQLFTSVQYNPV